MRKRATLNEARFPKIGANLIGSCSHPTLQASGPLFGHQSFSSLSVDEAVHFRQRLILFLIVGGTDIFTVVLNSAAHHGSVSAIAFVTLLACDEPFLATLGMGHDKTSVVYLQATEFNKGTG